MAVMLDGAIPDNRNADFGYYVEPGALGNRVWEDADSNGIQNAGENGVDDVEVVLVIDYPDGTSITLRTLSGDDPATGEVEKGWYSFGNLLLDEDYAAGSSSGAPAPNQPAYTISMVTPSGRNPTAVGADGSTPLNDSNEHAGTTAEPAQGSNDVRQQINPNAESDPIAGYDFGLLPIATAATLTSFTAERQASGVVLRWATASEVNLAGFDLYRAGSATGERLQINPEFIASKNSDFGAEYDFLDGTATAGVTYHYWLHVVDTGDIAWPIGPVVVGGQRIFLPAVMSER
jgi:hypothetical protein